MSGREDQVHKYKGYTFIGNWTTEAMEETIRIQEEMLESLKDPAKTMTDEEHTRFLEEEEARWIEEEISKMKIE